MPERARPTSRSPASFRRPSAARRRCLRLPGFHPRILQGRDLGWQLSWGADAKERIAERTEAGQVERAPPPQYFQELSAVAFHPPAVQGHGERIQVYEDPQGLCHHNAAARRATDGFDGVQRGQKADDRSISEYTAE